MCLESVNNINEADGITKNSVEGCLILCQLVFYSHVNSDASRHISFYHNNCHKKALSA